MMNFVSTFAPLIEIHVSPVPATLDRILKVLNLATQYSEDVRLSTDAFDEVKRQTENVGSKKTHCLVLTRSMAEAVHLAIKTYLDEKHSGVLQDLKAIEKDVRAFQSQIEIARDQPRRKPRPLLLPARALPLSARHPADKLDI